MNTENHKQMKDHYFIITVTLRNCMYLVTRKVNLQLNLKIVKRIQRAAI